MHDAAAPQRAPRQHRSHRFRAVQNAEEEDAMAQQASRVDTDAPDAALVRAEMRALLERKIDELPQDFRAVFVMRSVEELSVQETAECLGITEATVRTRHFRARSLLRESIAQELDVAERDAFSFDGARCDRIVSRALERVSGRTADRPRVARGMRRAF